MYINARPLRPPFKLHILEPVGNEDGTISVKDHEGNFIAHDLSVGQYESFCETFYLGCKTGAALEREALIFEFTTN